ncbi:cyclic-phosphate processing receiver domain-containing protein [Mangrovimonas cancribranchiae]|uniref:Cyclic-phosphate processing receiver domain-containing protein n=1 Tax=Mangrovimonas cancribranchiae TaxID=3080055 RepID=A0AAU6P9W9_9FLAO
MHSLTSLTETSYEKTVLDDIRTPEMVYESTEAKKFVVVRSYADFVTYIKDNGPPPLISFDNDLGLDKSGKVAPDGYAAAKWLVYESDLNLKDLKFNVHSANPVAAEQIRGLLNNYINFLNTK